MFAGRVPAVKPVQQPAGGQACPEAIAPRSPATKRDGTSLVARQLPPAYRQLPPASRQLLPAAASFPPIACQLPPCSRQLPPASRPLPPVPRQQLATPPQVLPSFGGGRLASSVSSHGAVLAHSNHAAQQATRSFPVLPVGKAEAGKPRAVRTGALPMGAVPLSTASRSFPVVPTGKEDAWKPHAAPAAPPASLASGLATAQPQVTHYHTSVSRTIWYLCYLLLELPCTEGGSNIAS